MNPPVRSVLGKYELGAQADFDRRQFFHQHRPVSEMDRSEQLSARIAAMKLSDDPWQRVWLDIWVGA